MGKWGGGAMGNSGGEFVELFGELSGEIAALEPRDLLEVGVIEGLAGELGAVELIKCFGGGADVIAVEGEAGVGVADEVAHVAVWAHGEDGPVRAKVFIGFAGNDERWVAVEGSMER